MIPNPANSQSLNRYSYVLNNPINANDPTGHYCVGDLEGCRDEVNGQLVNGAPLYLGQSGSGGGRNHDDDDKDNYCSAPWPWYCGDSPDLASNPDPFDGKPGISDATPDPWCGADWCVGDIALYRDKGHPIDARVISFNLVSGFSPWHLFAFAGGDVVWTSRGLVVFKVRAANTNWPASPDDVYTPQVGLSLTYGEITSDILRGRPGSEGIIQAWSGNAIQEGASLTFITVNSSSSVDSNGNPDFQTISSAGGYSLGFPDIIFEYHRYLTNAERVPYLIFNR